VCHLICVERPLAILLGRHFGRRALLRVLPWLGYKHTRHRKHVAVAATAARATAATYCEPAGQVDVGTGAGGEAAKAAKASARRRCRRRPRGRGSVHAGSTRRVEGGVLCRCNQRLGATQQASVRLVLALTAVSPPDTRACSAQTCQENIPELHLALCPEQLKGQQGQTSTLDQHPFLDLSANPRRLCIDRGRSSYTHGTDVHVDIQAGAARE